MNPEHKEILNARRWPARLTVEQSAVLLGFKTHDIPILLSRGLLKPLGNPPPNGVKYIAAGDVEKLGTDRRWLARCTDCLHEYWRRRSDRKVRPLPTEQRGAARSAAARKSGCQPRFSSGGDS